MASIGKTSPRSGKFRLSRLGRKLQISDDPRILLALPKDIPERTWAEILQKEENDLVCFEIREEIVEEALQIGYDNYMEKQTTFFTVHCSALAWLKLINWHFYRHDPGEEPSAQPLCYIPKRKESWIPDDPPCPSPKDCWGRQQLCVIEECPDLMMQRWDSSSSLEMNTVAEIPEEYWFPGKINLEYLPVEAEKNQTGGRHKNLAEESVISETSEPIGADSEMLEKVTDYSTVASSADKQDTNTTTLRSESASSFNRIEERFDNESEVLQNITDYGYADDAAGDKVKLQPSKQSIQLGTSQTEVSLQGGGDSTVGPGKLQRKRSKFDKSKSNAWASRHSLGKCKGFLPPLLADSLSRVTNISDCRLRNLRYGENDGQRGVQLYQPFLTTLPTVNISETMSSIALKIRYMLRNGVKM